MDIQRKLLLRISVISSEIAALRRHQVLAVIPANYTGQHKNFSVTKTLDSSSIQFAESKYGLRSQL
jgi:hypothetical protein